MKELKEARTGIIAVLALVSITGRLPTRRFSSGITTTLMLAGIVLLVAAGTVSADDIEITQAMIPYTTTTDGERYFLTTNLTCADTTTSAITIANNNVIIDGQGHKITGNISGTDCAPYDTSQTYPAPHCGVANIADKDNVVIQNLEIENFCTGIALGKRPGTGGNVDNNTVTGCKIHDCGKSTVVTHGIQMVWTNNCNITKNDIYEIDGSGIAAGCSGGGNGIFLFGDLGPERGWYNSITCNDLHNNNKSGFFTKHQCMHNTISYNLATYNTQSGIMPKCEKSNYNEFEYNNMSYNGVNGFYLGGDGNIIRYNTMLNNGAEGLGLKGTADSNTITNNTACGNGGTGDMNWTDVTNIGDSNTCDSGPAGACDWSCGSLTQVYYDFDRDGDCSKEAADCTCRNLLSVGSCCNPGLFNSSAASDYCDGVCSLAVGNDPNDCDAGIMEDVVVKPDLIVANKSEAWVTETTYNVSYRVQNIGNGTSNESVACVSIDATLRTAANKSIGELAPGTYSPVMTVGPFTISGTSDTVRVCADCDDNNTEWNETNNCMENTLDDPPPSLVTYTISNTTISPNGDGIEDDTKIHVKFSEYVAATIKIENATGVIRTLYTSSSVKNPDPKIWDGTDDSSDLVADGTYHVNITMDDGVNPLVYNNTGSIVVANNSVATISIGNVSGNVTIPITIENAANVGSAHINITYNASVVDVTNVTGEDFDTIVTNLEHVHEGWVRIGVFQGDNPGLNGSAILANVTFRSNSTNGTSQLNLSVITFKDATNNTNPIPYSVQNGTYIAVLNGDVNDDGEVDIADAMYLAKHVLVKSGFEEIIVGAADVNDDGVIDIADAMYLAKHVLGKSGFEELR